MESALKGLLFDLVTNNFEINDQSLKLLVVHMEGKKDLSDIHSFLESKAKLDIESAFEEITSQLAAKSRTSKL